MSVTSLTFQKFSMKVEFCCIHTAV